MDNLVIYVDIDETICFYVGERDYILAKPNHQNIAKINKLYEEGHQITYWTSRGTIIGAGNQQIQNYIYKMTKNQLDKIININIENNTYQVGDTFKSKLELLCSNNLAFYGKKNNSDSNIYLLTGRLFFNNRWTIITSTPDSSACPLISYFKTCP